MSTHPSGPSRRSDLARPLAGLATVTAIAAVMVTAVGLFRGCFVESIPVTVLSPRVGLVMNPDAKVKMLGIQVGQVTSIDDLPNGQAALHLAIDPDQLHLVPANVLVDIASTTVFGAKFVQLVAQRDLDSFLVSTIGLADIGNDVVGANRRPLTDVLRLLIPTTALTNEYHQALMCGLAGMLPLTHIAPFPDTPASTSLPNASGTDSRIS